jgi:hypothetical protein
MAKKSEGKKVKRIEMEKVKSGDGKSMHKVTVHFHPKAGKEGKGFGASLGHYQEPDETYHTSKAKAHKHFKKHFHNLTATPEEPIEQEGPGLSGDESQPDNEPGESVEE